MDYWRTEELMLDEVEGIVPLFIHPARPSILCSIDQILITSKEKIQPSQQSQSSNKRPSARYARKTPSIPKARIPAPAIPRG